MMLDRLPYTAYDKRIWRMIRILRPRVIVARDRGAADGRQRLFRSPSVVMRACSKAGPAHICAFNTLIAKPLFLFDLLFARERSHDALYLGRWDE